MAVLIAALLMLPASPNREPILRTSTACWQLADPGRTSHYPLRVVGRAFVSAPDGARPAVRMVDSYYDAGPELTVKGDQVTVYVRARDPAGRWTYALFAKRGNHDIVTFNLFSVDLPGTPGPDIGFELHTDAGFVMVSFPVSLIDPTAWHDLVGRYDGRSISLFCDGRLMARQGWRGRLTQNHEPALVGAETDNGRIVRLFTGEMEEAALWSRTLSDAEVAAICRKERVMPGPGYSEPYVSPIHFRPDIGRLADTIPFYWRGEYHVFYLRAVEKVPWEHIVSRDLIHWKELPTALLPDGAPDGPDGQHMFTGSVAADNRGGFHIFYTGHNDRNPAGTEFICHATSTDLVHWTKHPEDTIAPDGINYRNSRERDFRDPYVFWNEERGCYWMVFFGDEAKTGTGVQGIAESDDLKTWRQVEPLANVPGQECPDLFHIGDTWYLIGGDRYRWAKDCRGPYYDPPDPFIDRPFIYAAKRMFDGKRHIWTGWLWDRVPETDSGAPQWGGTQCLPRELYAGPDGLLFCRPVPEALRPFRHIALQVPEREALDHWSADVPPNYLLDCSVAIPLGSTLTLTMRAESGAGAGYRLIPEPDRQQISIAGPEFSHLRHATVDASKPVHIQAFVLGTMIECFVNDRYALSCRAYDHRTGRLGLSAAGGPARILALSVRTP